MPFAAQKCSSRSARRKPVSGSSIQVGRLDLNQDSVSSPLPSSCAITRRAGRRNTMQDSQTQERRIDQFFSGPGARADEWRSLLEAAKAWSSGSEDRNRFETLLGEIAVMEEFHAFPGPRLMY